MSGDPITRQQSEIKESNPEIINFTPEADEQSYTPLMIAAENGQILKVMEFTKMVDAVLNFLILKFRLKNVIKQKRELEIS